MRNAYHVSLLFLLVHFFFVKIFSFLVVFLLFFSFFFFFCLFYRLFGCLCVNQNNMAAILRALEKPCIFSCKSSFRNLERIPGADIPERDSNVIFPDLLVVSLLHLHKLVEDEMLSAIVRVLLKVLTHVF